MFLHAPRRHKQNCFYLFKFFMFTKRLLAGMEMIFCQAASNLQAERIFFACSRD